MSTATMTDLAFHELADLFPLMEGIRFEEFKSDIGARGQLDPIITHDGKIVDGRNRYRACRDLDVEPIVEEWDGEGSLLDFIVSRNLHRRHLTESQRAMVGAKIKPLYEAEAKQRQRGGQGGVLLPANLPEAKKGESREKAAEAVNVSPRSVDAASKVIADGVPELGKAVESGAVAVSAAAEVATLPKETQEKVVAGGAPAIKEEAKRQRERKAESKPKTDASDFEADAETNPEDETQESPTNGHSETRSGFQLKPQPPPGKGFEKLWNDMGLFLRSLPRRGGIVALMKDRKFTRPEIQGTYSDLVDTRNLLNKSIEEMEAEYEWLDRA